MALASHWQQSTAPPRLVRVHDRRQLLVGGAGVLTNKARNRCLLRPSYSATLAQSGGHHQRALRLPIMLLPQRPIIACLTDHPTQRRATGAAGGDPSALAESFMCNGTHNRYTDPLAACGCHQTARLTASSCAQPRFQLPRQGPNPVRSPWT
eukprot:4572956-Prymnesium_polylepis.4